MAQDGKHIPSKEFKDNYDRIFRKKKEKKKIMDHIQYAKNVLDPYMRQDLKSLLTQHCYELMPHYNFAYKGETPTNFIETVIRHLVGDTHHIEYWARNQLDHCLYYGGW